MTSTPQTVIMTDDITAPEGELSDILVNDIIGALDDDKHQEVREHCAGLQCEDVGELINQLSSNQREQLIDVLGDDLSDNVLATLDPDAVSDVISALGHEKAVEALSNIERDDALHLLEDLPLQDQQELLQSMQDDAREDLEQSFTYPEESAGRLMQKRFVSVPEFWSIGNTIDYLREKENLPENFYVIYVVDHRFHPKGKLPLSRIMQCGRDSLVANVMNTNMHTQQVETDQEEVAHVFRKYGLVEAPVTNPEGRLVGSITVDDVVFVIQEEDEEDFLKSAGLQSQDLYSTLMESVKQRFPWLFINLLTAIAASVVIDLYDETIQSLVLLAVLMPIIASMGGNAGIQSATIAVRALATKKVARSNAIYMIRKEICLAALNGLGLAIITGLGILLIYQDPHIAGVFAAATVMTMIIAGLSGAGLPFLLQRIGIDPAIASGVFLTMLTDIFGFLAFLGLASIVLM